MIDEPKNINQVFNPLKLVLVMLNHIIHRKKSQLCYSLYNLLFAIKNYIVTFSRRKWIIGTWDNNS